MVQELGTYCGRAGLSCVGLLARGNPGGFWAPGRGYKFWPGSDVTHSRGFLGLGSFPRRPAEHALHVLLHAGPLLLLLLLLLAHANWLSSWPEAVRRRLQPPVHGTCGGTGCVVGRHVELQCVGPCLALKTSASGRHVLSSMSCSREQQAQEALQNQSLSQNSNHAPMS